MGANDLDERLLNGEKIVWFGRPGQGLIITARDGLLIPFSLLWGGFAVFWESTVIRTHAPSFFVLFGVPFVLVGIYLIVGRFLFDAWIRSGMTYAVTNRRILISRSTPFSALIALNLDRLPEVNLVEGRGNRGTIRFGSQPGYYGRYGHAAWTPSLDPTPQFLAIDNVREVFDQIQRTAEALAKRLQ